MFSANVTFHFHHLFPAANLVNKFEIHGVGVSNTLRRMSI